MLAKIPLNTEENTTYAESGLLPNFFHNHPLSTTTPRSLTARAWKMVVGRRSFPIGALCNFSGANCLLNFRKVCNLETFEMSQKHRSLWQTLGKRLVLHQSLKIIKIRKLLLYHPLIKIFWSHINPKDRILQSFLEKKRSSLSPKIWFQTNLLNAFCFFGGTGKKDNTHPFKWQLKQKGVKVGTCPYL